MGNFFVLEFISKIPQNNRSLKYRNIILMRYISPITQERELNSLKVAPSLIGHHFYMTILVIDALLPRTGM